MRQIKKMKKIRSVFSSGPNLGAQIHRTKKGKGSYKRKGRRNSKLDFL